MLQALSPFAIAPLDGLTEQHELLYTNADYSAGGSVMLDAWEVTDCQPDRVIYRCRKYLSEVLTDLTVTMEYRLRGIPSAAVTLPVYRPALLLQKPRQINSIKKHIARITHL